jgi:tetratricopeptide (TPR) repeat protein
LVHFDQFNGIDRDQKNIEIAKSYFESLVRDYPNSPHTPQAQEKLARTVGYLADKQLAIAAFYQREGKLPAARARLEDIIQRYRETPAAAKALHKLAEIYRQEKNDGKAALAYEALIQHYPQSEHSKDARLQLVQLERTKRDPLEALLAHTRDGNSNPTNNGRREAAAPKETPLVAKTVVVHEEPGDEKGVFRKVAGAMNPLGWFSSDDNEEEKTAEKEKIETAQKEKSSGLLSSIWPGGKKPAAKAVVKTQPELIGKVDQSLESRGVAPGAKVAPPDATLPPVEPEPPKGLADAPALLGNIDARLKSVGKDATELPAAPAGLTVPAATTAPRAQARASATSDGIFGSIDQALKEKGVEPPRETVTVRKPSSPEASQPSVQLEPKLPVEKGPLFLELGEYPIQEKPAEVEQAKKLESPPFQPASIPDSLPKGVVQAPSQPQKQKPPETITAERKDGDREEEETKSGFGQIKDDLDSIGRILNPFKW